MRTVKALTFCRVCEPACGLVATVEDGRLTDLQPDREHPITAGFACPKGLAGVEINHDPDRLDHPFARLPDGRLEQRSWDDAIAQIAAATRSIVDRHGPNAIATYAGNPSGFNSLLGTALPAALRQLGARRYFNAGTQDCVNKYAGSNATFGTSYLHPVPDVDHAEMILLIGSNWRVSKASFVSMPNPYGRLMAAAKRGAKIRFVNPRRTESSTERTGPTIQILPDTDVYFLAAMLCEIDRSVGFVRVADTHGRNVDALREFVRAYTPERVADVCGVRAEEIIELAHEFATAKSAAVHMSTGVNMGRQGTLAYWLVHMLSFVTGNLDREGGNVVSKGYYDMASRGRSEFASTLRESEFGQVRTGEIPGGLLADYILDADEPVRALFVIAGNPLLSVPGQARLEKAFRSLELLVVIDIYANATSELAHWVLPSTDQFERADLGVSTNGMQLRPWVQFTDRVVAPQAERREEWWIFERLAQELGLNSLLDRPDAEEAKWSRIDHMLSGSSITRAALAESPRGIALPEREVGSFFEDSIQTADAKVDCCPATFGSALQRCATIFDELASAPAGQLRLISRRDSRMHNTWYQNVEGMRGRGRAENPLAIHPVDATRLGVVSGSRVTVRSDWGEIDATAELDGALRPGVVSMEHGWGRQAGMRRAAAQPGVNVNALLPSGPGSFDELSNQQFMSGIPVMVTPVAGAEVVA